MLANKYQTLPVHAKRVGELAQALLEGLNLKEHKNGFDLKALSRVAYYAGIFHDIGKVDPIFQTYIASVKSAGDVSNGVHIEKKVNGKNFSFEKHARHNEVSWAIVDTLVNEAALDGLNRRDIEILKNVVLWHHAAPYRKEPFTLSKIIGCMAGDKKSFVNNLSSFVHELKIGDLFTNDIGDFYYASETDLPRFKQRYSEKAVETKSIDKIKDDISVESATSLVRTILITADRLISSFKSEIPSTEDIVKQVFQKNLASPLTKCIEKMEKEFFPNSEKSKNQHKASVDLSSFNDRVAILNAPAGAGKTKTSLQWAANQDAEKLYYVAPRTIICEELYDELHKKYLPTNVSIALITGSKKLLWDGYSEYETEDEEELFGANIVITTIDQTCKMITTHEKITVLLDFLKSHVVFDEFHEYYKLSGFNMLFAEMIKLKSSLSASKTLIMSATPNYFFLDRLLDIYHPKSRRNAIVNFESDNKQPYNFKIIGYNEAVHRDFQPFLPRKDSFDLVRCKRFENTLSLQNPFYAPVVDSKKTIVISNAATTAQLAFLRNHDQEDALLAHSKFTPSDKANMLGSIKHSFGALDKEGCNTLRAGPIVQASLNITSHRLITDLSNPENILQRLGRLNRFGEDFIADFIIAIPEHILEPERSFEGKSETVSIWAAGDEKDSILTWLAFLRANMNEKGHAFYLSDIYRLYKDFYHSNIAHEHLEEELLKSLRKSCKNIGAAILDPVEVSQKGKKQEKQIMAEVSLRGSSLFVKMAKYDVQDNLLVLSDKYAKDITLSKERDIFIYDDNPKFVRDTVENITLHDDELTKTEVNSIRRMVEKNPDKAISVYTKKSRVETAPIAMSLTKEHMNEVGRNSQISDSVIYLTSESQNIGYIKLNKITQKEQ